MSPPTLESKGLCSGLTCAQCPECSDPDCLYGLCKRSKFYRKSGVPEEHAILTFGH